MGWKEFVKFILALFMASTSPLATARPVNATRENHHIEKRHIYFQHKLYSNESLYAHVPWGNATNRRWRGRGISLNRNYVGYGTCPIEWPVNYDDHIIKASNPRFIIIAFSEMFRLSCKPERIKVLFDLFEKGYARLKIDHSISFSDHAVLFMKVNPTFEELDDVEDLLEFAAFTQVYVSWIKFPITPLDPLGRRITDACFVEIVARLHVIDMVLSVAKRQLEQIAYLMGVKMKGILKIIIRNYRRIKGHEWGVEDTRKIARHNLIVALALMEFFFRGTEYMHKAKCAHHAFEKFFLAKELTYRRKAREYQKVQEPKPSNATTTPRPYYYILRSRMKQQYGK